MKKNRHQRAKAFRLVIRDGRLYMMLGGKALNLPKEVFEAIIAGYNENPNANIHLTGFASETNLQNTFMTGQIHDSDIAEMTTLTPHNIMLLASFYANHKDEIKE